jgi:hypothetical protein
MPATPVPPHAMSIATNRRSGRPRLAQQAAGSRQPGPAPPAAWKEGHRSSGSRRQPPRYCSPGGPARRAGPIARGPSCLSHASVPGPKGVPSAGRSCLGPRRPPPDSPFPARWAMRSASWPMPRPRGQGTVVLMRWAWSPEWGRDHARRHLHEQVPRLTASRVSARRRPRWEIPAPAAHISHVADDPGTGMGSPWNQRQAQDIDLARDTTRPPGPCTIKGHGEVSDETYPHQTTEDPEQTPVA